MKRLVIRHDGWPCARLLAAQDEYFCQDEAGA